MSLNLVKSFIDANITTPSKSQVNNDLTVYPLEMSIEIMNLKEKAEGLQQTIPANIGPY